MNATSARLRALRTAFLPLSDLDRVHAALSTAELVGPSSNPATVHCLGIQYKAYGRADAWARARAAVCYRVTCRTADGRTQERIFHGCARLKDAPDAEDLSDPLTHPATPPAPGATDTLCTPASPAAATHARGSIACSPFSTTAVRSEPLRATLGAMELRLWPFPQDPALPGLQPLWALPHGPEGVPPAVVSYRPGARAVLRYARHGDMPEIFAKAFASVDLARKVYERSRRIHAAGSATFCSAPPLALDAGNAAVWHLGVEGTPLPRTLAAGFDADLVKRMTQALAILHALPHSTLTCWSVTDQHADAGKKLGRLRQLCPQLERDFLALRRSLQRDLPAAIDTPEVSLHGDFHLRQWLRQGDRITLCDFDEICLGAPETDLASVLMDLSLYGLPTATVTAWTAVSTRTYTTCAPWGLRHRALEWQLRAQTINKMHRAYVQLQPDLTGRCRRHLVHLATVLKALRQP